MQKWSSIACRVRRGAYAKVTARSKKANFKLTLRWGINKLKGFIAPLVAKGLRSVILFGVPLKAPKVSFFSS